MLTWYHVRCLRSVFASNECKSCPSSRGTACRSSWAWGSPARLPPLISSAAYLTHFRISQHTRIHVHHLPTLLLWLSKISPLSFSTLTPVSRLKRQTPRPATSSVSSHLLNRKLPNTGTQTQQKPHHWTTSSKAETQQQRRQPCHPPPHPRLPLRRPPQPHQKQRQTKTPPSP